MIKVHDTLYREEDENVDYYVKLKDDHLNQINMLNQNQRS